MRVILMERGGACQIIDLFAGKLAGHLYFEFYAFCLPFGDTEMTGPRSDGRATKG